MEGNQSQTDLKKFKDNEEPNPLPKLDKKTDFEEDKKQLSKEYIENNIKPKNSIQNEKEINEEYNKEKSDENNTNEDTSQISDSSNKEISNKDSFSKLSSHSSSNLIKIDDIKNPIDDQDKNKSDDECEKIEKKKFKKKKNKKKEDIKNEGEIDKKEEEIMKNDNIDFNKNIRDILNNNGGIITLHKNEKEKDKDKENNENDKDKEENYELNFYKVFDRIRTVYYSQLLVKRVWKPIKGDKRHNNVIIFDWDDTLLPTSFLTPRGIFDEKNELNQKDQAKITKLEESVRNLLSIAISKADVYIITNAGEGWVQFSAEKYYPSIKEILEKIEIISARGKYEKVFPEDLKRWKIEAFLNIKKKLNDNLITNIICLGDSVFEMEAGRILASNFIHAVIKTIKFRENPKPEELNKQLNLVYIQFNSIFTSSKNLTVRVEKKKKKDE